MPRLIVVLLTILLGGCFRSIPDPPPPYNPCLPEPEPVPDPIPDPPEVPEAPETGP